MLVSGESYGTRQGPLSRSRCGIWNSFISRDHYGVQSPLIARDGYGTQSPLISRDSRFLARSVIVMNFS